LLPPSLVKALPSEPLPPSLPLGLYSLSSLLSLKLVSIFKCSKMHFLFHLLGTSLET
jgi:hypothetical protein